MRNLLFVALIGPSAWLGVSIVAAAIGILAAALIVFLYAYAEYTTFAEAYDIAIHSIGQAA